MTSSRDLTFRKYLIMITSNLIWKPNMWQWVILLLNCQSLKQQTSHAFQPNSQTLYTLIQKKKIFRLFITISINHKKTQSIKCLSKYKTTMRKRRKRIPQINSLLLLISPSVVQDLLQINEKRSPQIIKVLLTPLTVVRIRFPPLKRIYQSLSSWWWAWEM